MEYYRYCIEVERVGFETADRLEVSNNREEAEAALAAARQTWNEGKTVVVQAGDVDPIVLGEYTADQVVRINLVDRRERAA